MLDSSCKDFLGEEKEKNRGKKIYLPKVKISFKLHHPKKKRQRERDRRRERRKGREEKVLASATHMLKLE